MRDHSGLRALGGLTQAIKEELKSGLFTYAAEEPVGAIISVMADDATADRQ